MSQQGVPGGAEGRWCRVRPPPGSAHRLRESETWAFLTAYLPPSILGLWGSFGAMVRVGVRTAGWYGDARTGFVLWPFAVIFGGVGPGTAAFPSLRDRDGLAAGIQASWGAGFLDRPCSPWTPTGSARRARRWTGWSTRRGCRGQTSASSGSGGDDRAGPWRCRPNRGPRLMEERCHVAVAAKEQP